MRFIGFFVALISLPVQAVLAGDVLPRAVTTTRPRRRDVNQWIKLPATVEADSEVTIFAKVSGYLEDFNLDVGDIVKPGQTIGKLDAPELAEDVKLAEGQLETANGNYKKALAELDHIKLHGKEIDAQQKVLDAQVLEAKAKAEKTHKLCERTQKLFADNAATEQDKESQEFTCQEYDAGIKVVENKIEALKADREVWQSGIAVTAASADEAKGKVSIAQATLDRARTWLAYAELKVPQIGTHNGAAATVTKRFVSNGDLITGGSTRPGSQPLVTLTVADPVRVIAFVPESDCVGIVPGTIAEVFLRSTADEHPIVGKISRTTNSLSASSRTLRVEVDIPNKDGMIKPGVTANIQIVTALHQGVLAVPANSVSIEKRMSAVYTVADGKAHRVPVQTGFHDHDVFEVIAPTISENTPVITEVREGVSDGVLVDVKQP